jgi:hypothetical protein
MRICNSKPKTKSSLLAIQEISTVPNAKMSREDDPIGLLATFAIHYCFSCVFVQIDSGFVFRTIVVRAEGNTDLNSFPAKILG